jgi:hypothetical protein
LFFGIKKLEPGFYVGLISFSESEFESLDAQSFHNRISEAKDT